MIDTLATFADQVTNVAREVGIEGKLGGQARVPGAAGLWRDLTDNVNQLAANLTTQVRAIAEVSTAVTKGDLTRSITVEALGRSGRAEGQHQRDDPQPEGSDAEEHRAGLAEDQPRPVHPHAAGRARSCRPCRTWCSPSWRRWSTRSTACSTSPTATRTATRCSTLAASYAFNNRKHLANQFRLREGLIGQCAHEKSRILLTNVPPDYVQISSGLGEAPPLNIIVLPALFEGEVKAVIELASFSRFSETHQSLPRTS